MPSRFETVRGLEQLGLIAVIRAENAQQAVDTCRALRDGGVLAWEIAMTTPGALEAIARVRSEFGRDGITGVGTVLDRETAVAAIHAGAEFVFSPIFDPEIIQAAHRYDRACVPGALTPTEISSAWSAGADLVKVFPANQFGPSYFQDLRGPLPHVKLTPTGGVDRETIPAWVNAGAAALGVGSALVRKDLLKNGDWNGLTALAQRFTATLAAAREQRKG